MRFRLAGVINNGIVGGGVVGIGCSLWIEVVYLRHRARVGCQLNSESFRKKAGKGTLHISVEARTGLDGSIVRGVTARWASVAMVADGG